jgi:Mg-chelatase subunit ChlD
MAREAGAYAPKYPIGPHDVQFSVASLEHFFRMAQEAEADRITNESKHIIKRAEARGAAAEREACANLLLNVDLSSMDADHRLQSWTATVLLNFSDAIRARGEK